MWGAATAAFQIEGATTADGRGESIWDRFALDARQGRERRHGRPGLRALPPLAGRPRPDAVARARRLPLLDRLAAHPAGRARTRRTGRASTSTAGSPRACSERGIRPLATLYHWDLPQALEDEGGWALARRRRAVRRVRAASSSTGSATSSTTGSRTTSPGSRRSSATRTASKAPGRPTGRGRSRAAHHPLLSHGAAVRAFRERGGDGRIGITLDLTIAEPASESAEDVAAAQRLDGHHNRWFLDPVFSGSYPSDMVELYERDASGLWTSFRTATSSTDRAADRLPRRQLLPAEPGRGRRRRHPPLGLRERRAVRAARRRWAGRSCRRR